MRTELNQSAHNGKIIAQRQSRKADAHHVGSESSLDPFENCVSCSSAAVLTDAITAADIFADGQPTDTTVHLLSVFTWNTLFSTEAARQIRVPQLSMRIEL